MVSLENNVFFRNRYFLEKKNAFLKSLIMNKHEKTTFNVLEGHYTEENVYLFK